MDRNEFLKQLADVQCRNVLLEEKYSAAQYEAECLQKDLKRSQSEVANLQRSLEAAQEEIFDLKRTAYDSGANSEALRALQAESAATIEELRQENRNARRRVDEVEKGFRLLKESQTSGLNPLVQEDYRKQLFEWKRRLGLRASANAAEVFTAINDRLDRGLTYEARTNEADFAQQELKNQLRESHNSASELANRVEALLAEKDALKREASLWNTEKLDLTATRGLLEQRVAALEHQVEEMREKLVAETEVTRQVRLESQQLLRERNSQTVQFNALVESLAATLSVIESPCEPTEAAIKERVTKLITELQSLKKAQLDLEKRVEHLGKQFEFQFTNGQTLAEELNALKGELKTEHKAKERLQCELDGFRLMNSQKQLNPQSLGKVVALCAKLRIQVEKHSHSELMELIANKVEDLLDNGCISSECIRRSNLSKHRSMHQSISTRNAQHYCNQEHNSTDGLDDCPSCAHLQTTPLDLANHAPDWGDLEVKRVQCFCAGCLVCLAMALRQRLQAVMTVAPDREKQEKELLGELEKAKREMEEMHEKIMKMEHEKSEEYEKLEQMVSKLEALRQHQAKRIAGLQSKTQRQSTLEAQKDQQLSAAKNFLIENRQKQLRLLNFRNTLGRILGLDAWLTPNPEALIIQRVQQILLNASAQSRTLFPTQAFAPFPLSLSTFTTQQLPALPGPSYEFQEDGLTAVQGSPNQSRKVNFNNQKPGLNANPVPRRSAACARSQSARGRDTRKY